MRVPLRGEHGERQLREIGHVDARDHVGPVAGDAKTSGEKATVKAPSRPIDARGPEHGGPIFSVGALGLEPRRGAWLGRIDVGPFVDTATRGTVDAGRRYIDDARRSEQRSNGSVRLAIGRKSYEDPRARRHHFLHDFRREHRHDAPIDATQNPVGGARRPSRSDHIRAVFQPEARDFEPGESAPENDEGKSHRRGAFT